MEVLSFFLALEPWWTKIAGREDSALEKISVLGGHVTASWSYDWWFGALQRYLSLSCLRLSNVFNCNVHRDIELCEIGTIHRS